MIYGMKQGGVVQWEDVYEFNVQKPKDILLRLNTLMYQWMTHATVDGLLPEVEAIIGELAGILGYENWYEVRHKPKTSQAQSAWRRHNEVEKATHEWFHIHGRTAPEEQQRAVMAKLDKATDDLIDVCIAHIMERYKLSYQQAEKRYYRESRRYGNFLLSIHAMLDALKKEPIMTDSGRYEEKPLSPRTYADVQNEIANSLVGLPNFTTRVKIATTNGTVEHTIKTLEPEKGLYGKPLQERIDRIRARNIQLGYFRERTKVEAEIAKRQTGCSGGSAPAHPQKPPQPPQRFARQVPLQGKCPNCGFSNNPPTARFCMQCGTKLT